MTNPAPLTPQELADLKGEITAPGYKPRGFFYESDVARLIAALEAAWAENERLLKKLEQHKSAWIEGYERGRRDEAFNLAMEKP